MSPRTAIRFGRFLRLASSAFAIAVFGTAGPALAQGEEEDPTKDEAAAEEAAAEEAEAGEAEAGEAEAGEADAEPAEGEAEKPSDAEATTEAPPKQEAVEAPAVAGVEAKKEPAPAPEVAPAAKEPALPDAAGTGQPRDAESGQDLVTRLPPSPEVRIRGIKGGSLIRIWHGLQWPHYARTGIPISGDVWVDNGYERQGRGLDAEQNRNWWIQAGRFKLRVTPTYTSGSMFVQAQGELMAWSNPVRGNLPIDVDDAWIKVGAWDAWDIQVGRFEAWEVYHKGLGLDLYTLEYNGAIDPERDTRTVWLYELNHMLYREDGYGQLAIHVYPLDLLRFELSGVLGNEVGLNSLGVRPVGILDLGWMKFKVGAEYRLSEDWEEGRQTRQEHRGLGAGLQFIIDPYVEFGVNGAYSLVDLIDADGRVNEMGSINPLSIGGFLNVSPIGDLVIGGGVHHTRQDDRQVNDGVYGYFEHLQVFGAIVHPIITDSLTAKLVIAYAEADLRPSFDNWRVNTMSSVRLRVQYDF